MVNYRTILLSERRLHKDYKSTYSAEKKIAGHESQGACRQDKLIGGELPVMK
jgi:hypothetical protein